MNAMAEISLVCPKCGEAFERKRKDQTYCSRACQRHASRGPRTLTQSPAERRRQEARAARVKGLMHALYETPPRYRAEFLEGLLAEARGNAELRAAVTRRECLRSWAREEGTGRLHIAHVLDHYCREVYGLRSFVVVNPETELSDPKALAFPAEYFGPDAPPVYEDGSLLRRPCPWATRHSQSAPTTIRRNREVQPSRAYVRRDPEEFLADLRAMRAKATKGEDVSTMRLIWSRLAYAEEVGLDQNVNAPL